MDASPLAILAPELRNHIYAFVFDSEYAITLQSNGTQHALTKTCRQLRRETLELYYTLSTLNAHLDDGPSTPLANWLRRIGRSNVLFLNEINVWDLHMKNATIYGAASTQRLLSQPPGDDRKKFILQPTGTWLMNQGWYLKAVVIALHSMGLELRNIGKIPVAATSPSAANAAGEGANVNSKPEMTSDFAIVPRSDASTSFAQQHPALDSSPEFRDLLSHLGFTEDMLSEAATRMSEGGEDFKQGCREMRLRRGRREIFLYFTDGMFTSVRQSFVPPREAEEFTPF
jgi:hypothetical protein